MNNTEVEHASLRQEIIASGSHSINVANIVVTISGAALFAGFQFRNPYIVLFPLFALYYGCLILFNNSQTIARTSVYLRLVEKEQYEIQLAKLRSAIRTDEQNFMRKIAVPLRWLTPHTMLWEQWIGPILQNFFIVVGLVCIASSWLISFLVVGKPIGTSGAPPDLILDPISNSILLVIVTLIWVWTAFLVKRNTATLYGEVTLVGEYETAWGNILNTATRESHDAGQGQSDPVDTKSAEGSGQPT